MVKPTWISLLHQRVNSLQKTRHPILKLTPQPGGGKKREVEFIFSPPLLPTSVRSFGRWTNVNFMTSPKNELSQTRACHFFKTTCVLCLCYNSWKAPKAWIIQQIKKLIKLFTWSSFWFSAWQHTTSLSFISSRAFCPWIQRFKNDLLGQEIKWLTIYRAPVRSTISYGPCIYRTSLNANSSVI